LVAHDALVRGGTLHVGAENRDGECEIVIRAVGPRIILDETVKATLTGAGDEAQIDSRSAAAWMVYSLGKINGGVIQIASPAENELIIGALVR